LIGINVPLSEDTFALQQSLEVSIRD